MYIGYHQHLISSIFVCRFDSHHHHHIRVRNPVPVSDILHCNALAREENIETQAHEILAKLEIMAKLEMPNSYLRRELLKVIPTCY